MEDKRRREVSEKQLNDEQAAMWQVDFKNYSEEERRLHDKVSKINRDNQDFLRQQMQNKHAASKKMNKQEFLLNKPLLREINEKKKGVAPSKMGDNESLPAI